MSEGPGRGHGTARPLDGAKGPRFNHLVNNLLGRESAPTTSKENLNGVTPSKHLPATGLKRNTDKWKEEHPEESEPRGRHSRASSSSSIPSRATSEEDERTEAELREGQEGPRGRGPGGHEDELPQKPSRDQEKKEGQNGWFTGLENHSGSYGAVMDSPVEDTAPRMNGYVLGPVENGHDDHSNGRTDSFLPEKVDQPNGDGIPQSQAPKDPSAHTRSDEPLNTHSHNEGQTGEEGEKKQKRGKQLSEEYEGRDSERERKLTDEAGRRPDGLPGVKQEELPGPRNEIVLDPRISHMSVS